MIYASYFKMPHRKKFIDLERSALPLEEQLRQRSHKRNFGHYVLVTAILTGSIAAGTAGGIELAKAINDVIVPGADHILTNTANDILGDPRTP